MRGNSAALCIVALASCTTTYHISVPGHALRKKSRELRFQGQATVEATKYSSSDFDKPIPWKLPIRADQQVTDNEGRTRWVRDLLRGCDDEVAAAANIDCELDQPMARFRTHEWETRSTARFVQLTLGGAILGTLGGAIACNAFCDEDTTIHDVSHVAVYTMGIALAAVLVWGIIDCAGKWGQPGCRD
jgi:hypothetical protein